jgi:hypothetical protein
MYIEGVHETDVQPLAAANLGYYSLADVLGEALGLLLHGSLLPSGVR